MQMTGLRLLAPVRLSRRTEETTNPETQREAISDYAEEGRHSLIWCAEDMDVSGGIPIKERPGVGPWLIDDHLDDWDAICGAELDRLFRDARDFFNFARDMAALGKWVIDVSDGTDTSTRRGMEALEDRAIQAERERNRTAEKRRKAQDRMRNGRRWPGGKVVYGLRAYKADFCIVASRRELKGWFPEVHPEQGPIVNWMADEVIAGHSCGWLELELFKRGIVSPQGKERWPHGTVCRLLRNPVLRGEIWHYPPKVKGKKRPKPVQVLDHDGMPARWPARVLTDEKWDTLQAALDRVSSASETARRDASKLLGVAKCFLCDHNLYNNDYWRLEQHWRTYRCPQRQECRAGLGKRCPARSVNADWLETKTRDVFLAEAGHVPIMTKIVTPDTSSARQLAAVGRQIADLTAERFVHGVQRPDYDEVMASLTTQHAALAAAPGKPPETRWEDTGRTVADEWEARDDNGKRLLMINAGFSVSVAKVKSGIVLAHTFDPDLERRAGLAAMGSKEVPAIPKELLGAHTVLMFDRHGKEAEFGPLLAEFDVRQATEV